MANAKILKTDVVTSSATVYTSTGNGFDYVVTELSGTAESPHDETFALGLGSQIYQPDNGVSYTYETHDTNGNSTSYYNTAFRLSLTTSTSFDFVGLAGLNLNGSILDLSDFTFKALSRDVTTYTATGFGQYAADSEEVRITTSAAHGLNVGDYVALSIPANSNDHLKDDTTPTINYAYLVSVNGIDKPMRVSAVPSTTQFVINHPSIYVRGSSASLEDNATVYTFTEDYSVALADDYGIQILTPVSSINPDICLIEYQSSNDASGILSIGRLFLGTWFQPAKNVQPSQFQPVNNSERIQMSDNSWRYENIPATKAVQVEWKTLTKSEWLELQAILEERGGRGDILYTMFPDVSPVAWEKAHEIVGVISSWDQYPLIEDGSDYVSGITLQIDGAGY